MEDRPSTGCKRFAVSEESEVMEVVEMGERTPGRIIQPMNSTC